MTRRPGPLVVSWRDARNDPANTLVATYIATSIDGGNTFSAQTYANLRQTAVDAINPTMTDVIGPFAGNATGNADGRSANSRPTPPTAIGSSMGLAVYNGQVYPCGPATSTRPVVNNAAPAMPCPSCYRPMVIAAGPRIVNSTMGPIPYAEAASGAVSFTVTFDRPINPPGDPAPRSPPADVQVFYHDTTNGDPSIPLEVLSVTPVASSGVGPDNKFGFTEFTVIFSVTTSPTGPQRHRELHRHLQLPDRARRRNGNPIVAPIVLRRHRLSPSRLIRPSRLDRRAPADPAPRARAAPAPATTPRPRRSPITGKNNHIITGVTVTCR